MTLAEYIGLVVAENMATMEYAWCRAFTDRIDNLRARMCPGYLDAIRSHIQSRHWERLAAVAETPPRHLPDFAVTPSSLTARERWIVSLPPIPDDSPIRFRSFERLGASIGHTSGLARVDFQ